MTTRKTVRRMWAHKEADILHQEVLAMTAVKGEPKGYHKFTQQVAVVSLAKDDFEQLVERAAMIYAECDEIHWLRLGEETKELYRDSARRVLNAVLRERRRK